MAGKKVLERMGGEKKETRVQQEENTSDKDAHAAKTFRDMGRELRRRRKTLPSVYARGANF